MKCKLLVLVLLLTSTVAMADELDDACNPVLRLHDSKLDDDDIDIVGDYELTRQQKLLNAAQKTRGLFQGMKIRR